MDGSPERTSDKTVLGKKFIIGSSLVAAALGTCVVISNTVKKDATAVVGNTGEGTEKINLVGWAADDLDKVEALLIESRSGINSEQSEYLLRPHLLVKSLDDVTNRLNSLTNTLTLLSASNILLNSGVAYKHTREIEKIIQQIKGTDWDAYIKRVSVIFGLETNRDNFMLMLSKSLKAMEVEYGRFHWSIDRVASADVPGYSNVDDLNKNLKRLSPREELQHVFGHVDNYLIAYYNNQYKKDASNFERMPIDCVTAQAFKGSVEELGFVKLDKEYDESNFDESVKYHKLVYAGADLMLRVLTTASKSALIFENSGQSTTHPHIRQLQEMLARGGYYDYRKLDTTYGAETHKAYKQFMKDAGYGISGPEYLEMVEK